MTDVPPSATRTSFPVRLSGRTCLGVLGALPAAALVAAWPEPSTVLAAFVPATALVAPWAVLGSVASATWTCFARRPSPRIGAVVGACGATVAYVGGVVPLLGVDAVPAVLLASPADPAFAALAVGVPCGALAASVVPTATAIDRRATVHAPAR